MNFNFHSSVIPKIEGQKFVDLNLVSYHSRFKIILLFCLQDSEFLITFVKSIPFYLLFMLKYSVSLALRNGCIHYVKGVHVYIRGVLTIACVYWLTLSL